MYFIFWILFAFTNMQAADSKMPSAEQPVIVVGGGLAGLSAALQAFRDGASVVLIEGEKNLGGNSAKASSGIAACNTATQEAHHIKDSTDLFYSDTMTAGDRENDPVLVDILVHKSAEAVDFLMETGVNLSDVNLCGGHSVKRVHWVPQPKEGRPVAVGWEIIKALSGKLNELAKTHPDKIKILLSTEVVGLVTWNEFVTGVRIMREGEKKIEEISGKAIILCTGGFSHDRSTDGSLLMEYAPDTLSFPTTNGPWATGRGVKMARAMGAALIGMNRVQIHPTAFVDLKEMNASTKFLAAEALRGKGAILINEKGERFSNELGRRDYLTKRIMQFCATNADAGNAHIAYMLMSEQMVDDFGRASFNFYANIKGFFSKFSNAQELAKYMGINENKLVQTLNDYNQFVGGTDMRDSFGKTVFPVAMNPDETIYAAQITPAVHYTMGGLKINKEGFVYNEAFDRPFKGLLAAGEATGGVHGSNRLAGNSLLECVVYGRIAGQSAAAIHYTPYDDTTFNKVEL